MSTESQRDAFCTLENGLDIEGPGERVCDSMTLFSYSLLSSVLKLSSPSPMTCHCFTGQLDFYTSATYNTHSHEGLSTPRLGIEVRYHKESHYPQIHLVHRSWPNFYWIVIQNARHTAFRVLTPCSYPVHLDEAKSALSGR